MRIIVCVKQVPDTAGKVVVNKDGTLNRASMETITNPDDMSALEAALTLKDKYGSHVCVMSMGPTSAENMFREMLAMGADEAVLISSREFSGSDTFATSQILAASIAEYGCDEETLILCGRQAIDGDTAQVGPQIAEKLNLPQITYVSDIVIDDHDVLCTKVTDEGYMKLRTGLPCLLACMKEMNHPRYMTAPGIMEAYEKPLTIFDYERLKDNPLIRQDTIGLKGSPTNIYKSFTLKQGEKVTQMLSADRDGCAEAAEEMVKKFIIRRGVRYDIG